MQSPEQVRPRSVWLISWSVIALCLINLAGGLFSWTVSSVQEGTPAGADAPWLPSILSIVCVLAATALLAGTAVGMLRGNRWSRAVFLWSVPLLGLAGYALYGLDVSLSTAGVWLCLYVVSFFILLGPAESAYFKGRGDGAVQARPMRTGWVPAAILLVGTPAMYLAATALWGRGACRGGCQEPRELPGRPGFNLPGERRADVPRRRDHRRRCRSDAHGPGAEQGPAPLSCGAGVHPPRYRPVLFHHHQPVSPHRSDLRFLHRRNMRARVDRGHPVVDPLQGLANRSIICGH